MTPHVCVKVAIARMEDAAANLGETRYRVVECEHGTILLRRKSGNVSDPNEWEWLGWVKRYNLDDKEWR